MHTANGGQQDDARFPHTSNFGVRTAGASRRGGCRPDAGVLETSHVCKREAHVVQDNKEFEAFDEFEAREYQEIPVAQRDPS